MAYVVIGDFKAGLDRRKLPEASPQGSLQTLVNAHISRGGEVEKRLAWVPTVDLPAGQTLGFAGVGAVKYVFGSAAGVIAPLGVIYQQLSHPAGVDLSSIQRVQFYDGKPFVSAKFVNGDVLQFYDGAKVTDFDAGSGSFAAGLQPRDLLTHKDKMYFAAGSLLGFSGIDEPTKYQDTDVGAGFKNMSNQAGGAEELTALGRYQGYMAIFARRAIQLWYLDPDPVENVQKQVLDNIGTFAPKSVVSFGDVDVFFLSDSGVRSLRARDSSNQAGAADIGTPIDDFLLDQMAELSEAQLAAAVGFLEPINGRYVLTVDGRQYVFSYFASSRISAWSTYEPGLVFTDFAVMGKQVWARAGDKLYVLGGLDGRTYDDAPVTVELPYIDGRQIASFKNFKALDVVCEGEWKVEVNTTPHEPNVWSLVATVNGTTVTDEGIGFVAHSPLIKLRLTSAADGAARLSQVVIHYDPAEAT